MSLLSFLRRLGSPSAHTLHVSAGAHQTKALASVRSIVDGLETSNTVYQAAIEEHHLENDALNEVIRKAEIQRADNIQVIDQAETSIYANNQKISRFTDLLA